MLPKFIIIHISAAQTQNLQNRYAGGDKVDICNKHKRVNTYISNRINS